MKAHKLSLWLAALIALPLFLYGCKQDDDTECVPVHSAPQTAPVITLVDPIPSPITHADQPPLATVVDLPTPFEQYTASINDDPAIIAKIKAAMAANPEIPDTADRVCVEGINKFDSAYAPDLNGCITDPWRMAVFLVRKTGIAPECVRVFTDSQVTKKATVIRWTKTRKAPGRWVIYHSGHGALIPQDYPGFPQTVSRGIALYKFDWTRETTMTNSDVKIIFSQENTPGIGFIGFDTCYSGNIFKKLYGPGVHTGHTKEITPPPDIQARINKIRAAGGKVESFRSVLQTNTVTFFEACSPTQTSVDGSDDKGIPCGEGTFGLLRRLEYQVDQPMNVVIKDVDNDLSSEGYDQTPQVEGPGASRAITK
jgi:hypothetical protein